MALPAINWITGVISVPLSYMTLVQSVPTVIYELDLSQFHLDLRDLEDDVDGRPWPETHSHNTIVTVGGVTLARVIEILAPYTVTFEDGQYAVNLVGANSNVGDRVNVNQVSVRSANSAGLVQVREIQDAAFGGEIALDALNGEDSETFPTGLHRQPAKYLTNVAQISAYRGIEAVAVHGSYDILATDNVAGMVVKGENAITTFLTVDALADVTNAQFQDLIMYDSVLGANAYLNHCVMVNVSGIYGYVESCMMSENITLAGAARKYFVDCKSGCVGLGVEVPVIDFNNELHNVAFRNWSGPVKVANMTAAGSTLCFDVTSGATVIIDPSCTAGNVRLGGAIELLNSGGPGVTFSKAALIDGAKIDSTNKLLKNKTVTDPVAGTMTVYDDDEVTVLFVANIWENVGATLPYQGNAINRRDRLV